MQENFVIWWTLKKYDQKFVGDRIFLFAGEDKHFILFKHVCQLMNRPGRNWASTFDCFRKAFFSSDCFRKAFFFRYAKAPSMGPPKPTGPIRIPLLRRMAMNGSSPSWPWTRLSIEMKGREKEKKRETKEEKDIEKEKDNNRHKPCFLKLTSEWVHVPAFRFQRMKQPAKTTTRYQ